MGLYQTKNLLHSKSKKMKRPPTVWEKIFANHISDKELISKIHKQLIQFNSKTSHDSIKNGRGSEYFSKEDIQMAN